jgi:hypothetical protein
VTEDGFRRCSASADSRTSSGSQTSNFGSSTYLRIRAGSPAFRSYIRFNVTGVSSVGSATLRLYAYDGADSGGSVYSTSTSWVESTINWLNQPTLGSLLDTAGAVTTNTWVEYDVTSAVTGNGLVSFGLSSTSTDSPYFNSREAYPAEKPELVIEP